METKCLDNQVKIQMKMNILMLNKLYLIVLTHLEKLLYIKENTNIYIAVSRVIFIVFYLSSAANRKVIAYYSLVSNAQIQLQ